MKKYYLQILLLSAFILPLFAATNAADLSRIRLADANARAISIPAGDLLAALDTLAKQNDIQLVYRRDQLQGIRTQGVNGTYTTQDAVKKLIEGTQLRLSTDANTGAMLISPNTNAQATSHSRGGKKTTGMVIASAGSRGEETEGAQAVSIQKTTGETAATDGSSDRDSKGVPEILVKGKRSLNTDIKRTEDAPQPYVVFDKEEIQRSQALNLEDFLRTRLPMNTASTSAAQAPGSADTTSSINLRGLGANQTLILVDGRRMPGIASAGTPLQPDVNGIPFGAIERIEVLPSTASGIYGGSATGGVINIILRRDFSGLEARANYMNTFDTDAGSLRLDGSAGFSLEGGRTQIMIAATRSQANALVMGDRSFAARSIGLQLRNNPAAITGSFVEPFGNTVNIRSLGGNLVLDPVYGSRALGSPITHIPLGYAGPASDNGAALVANAGRYNVDVPAGVNGLERGLVAVPSMESASLHVRREFGARLEAFLDLSRLGNKGLSFNASSIPNSTVLLASAPNNPFQQTISVRFPTPRVSFENRSASTTARIAGGFILRLPHDWMSELSYGWSRSRFQTIGTGFAVDSVATCVLSRGVGAGVDPDGAGSLAPCAANDSRPALNALQEGNTFPLDLTPYLMPSPNTFTGPFETILKDATLRFSGPVVDLPGGALSLSALIEHREEGIQDAFVQTINFTTRAPVYAFYPQRSQGTDSYYLEARAPLVSPGNALPLVRELELQASVRRDEYKTRSIPTSLVPVPSRDGPFPALTYSTGRLDSTDYTLGLRYAPLEDLALRVSYGTGFLPSSVAQIAPTPSQYPGSLGIDPKRGNTPMYVGVPFTLIQGGTPNLRPEHSASRSAGIIFTPRFAPDFRLSIDYTRIEKVDEIRLPDTQFILDNEDILPGRIVRGPARTGDPVNWAGPIIQFDWTLLNIAQTSVEAYDIQADYTLATQRHGEFHWYAIATRQQHYRTQTVPNAPVVDSVGFMGGPLIWRGNLGLEWSMGPMQLSWNAQYLDSYMIYTATALPATIASTTLNQGSATVPSQMYHDLIASYHLDRFDSEISFGIRNLFDRSPPILATVMPGSAGYSAYGDPRLRRYSVSFRKAFGSNR